MTIKKNWKTLLITSLVILLPIVAGLILWDQLPDKIPMHWGPSGEVDGWGSKPFFVFGIPALMLVFQWLMVLGTQADTKKKNHAPQMVSLVLWIVPVLQIMLTTITYMTALGHPVRVEIVIPVFMGILLAIVGNYMPKCKQNYTIGIKIPWTLDSEENWNKTHRMAGWTWTIGGVLIAAIAFLGNWWIPFVILMIMTTIPIVYSYLLYRKGI